MSRFNRKAYGHQGAPISGISLLLSFVVIATLAPPTFAAERRAGTEPTAIGPTRIVTDETGRRVKVPVQVRRIVSLAPDLTETIYALGLEERLAGDTNYCDTPPSAKEKPHVGQPLNPSLEAIVALHPDLVLASTSINRRETVEALARLGIAVFASNPHTVRGTLGSIERIAEAMGAETKGKALVAGLQKRLDTLQIRTSDLPLVHVLLVVWENPLISIGQNTFIADALRWAGAESVIVSDQNWPQVSFEEVVRLQPDYIVFTDTHTGRDSRHLAELRSRPDWRGLRSVELGNVIALTDEIARPSARLVGAIEQLARELHPDIVPQLNRDTDHPLGLRSPLHQDMAIQKECAPCVR